MSIQVSESVGIGHPDKIADVIADSLLEKILLLDIYSQVGLEVLISKNLIIIAGELFSKKTERLDLDSILSPILTNLGYSYADFYIREDIKLQSLDIRTNSIENSKGIVSGDQSIVVGYAVNETKEYMPLSFVVASDLVKYVHKSINSQQIHGGKLDCKSLVVLNGKSVEHLVLSVQHEEFVDLNLFKQEILKYVIIPVVDKYKLDISSTKLFINSSGKFVIGGLDADTGITNRKLMVDSYGPSVYHGGGGYSGKDLTKVDRLGAYFARWVCKNFVASELCTFMELKLIFCFGSEEPLNFFVNTDLDFDNEKIIEAIKFIFPIKFSDIYFLFNKPNIPYSKLSCYGHFGREDLNLPWEQLDRVNEIKNYFS